MKHVAIVPLIGGFALAATKVLNKEPEAIYSYKGFLDNDSLYLNYLDNKVPYYIIDQDYSIVKDIDLATGVPPCSGLSTASNITDRKNAPVNDHMFNAAKFTLSILKPKIYVFENAPGLYTDVGKFMRDKLLILAEKNQYSLTFYKTNSLKHGIPQNRNRTYCIFYKGTNAPILKLYNNKPKLLVDFLNEVPKDSLYYNMYSKESTYTDYETYKFIKFKYGMEWREIILGCRRAVDFLGFLNLNDLWDEFLEFTKDESMIKTIKHIQYKNSLNQGYRQGYNNVIFYKDYVDVVYGEVMNLMSHPTEERFLNVSEYMHLMGLPLDMKLTQKDIGKIGQNVPCQTSIDIITECTEILKGNRNFALTDFYMQSNT